MDYRILGPLEALDSERRLPLGGARQRSVLALLLLHGNEALTRDVIIDRLWGDEPPATAAKVLQNCVSALRKELPGGTETLRTVGGAYALTLGPDELLPVAASWIASRPVSHDWTPDGVADLSWARTCLMCVVAVKPGVPGG